MSDKFREQLSKLSGRPSTGGVAPVEPAEKKPALRYRSAVVRRIDRAGRAPYNFVPLTDGKWKKVAAPPLQNAWTGNSGEIELHITAKTDFYVRGLQKLASYDPGRPTTEPFQVGQKMRLPGSSLRGMIRNLAEILARAPLDPVNDDQLFFRSVAAVPDPDNPRSFEPQAAMYKRHIGNTTPGSPSGLKVKPGYLHTDRDLEKWYIAPALDPSIYRIDGEERYWERRPNVLFSVHTPPMAVIGSGRPGHAIYSGPIQKKHRQWVIADEDKKADRIDIPKADVQAYLDNGQVDIQDLGPHFKQASPAEKQRARKQKTEEFTYSPKDAVVKPCFYVKWPGIDGTPHVSFGHTPHFRLPYEHSTGAAIPKEWRREKNDRDWDLVQAIFGRVPRPGDDGQTRAESGRRSRVFFEDAVLLNGETDTRTRSVVLGTPKPTTYQHYLVQPAEELPAILHWDGDYKLTKGVDPVVRGHKMYWHRPDAPIRESFQPNVSTQFRAGKKGCEFRAKIRYENLSDEELGLLLSTIELPPGCGHRLGMAKPLGLGSFQIRICSMREFSRTERYSAFGKATANGWVLLETGETSAGEERRQTLLRKFETWYGPDADSLWKDSRLAELKALLTLDGLPPDWNDRTRYLEFGKLRSEGRYYNEYVSVGRDLQKRRPLPPATQVLKGQPKVPVDPRPDFQ